MTMVEKLVRALPAAIATADTGDGNREISAVRDGAIVVDTRIDLRRLTCALLAVMREPTAEMLPEDGVFAGFFHDADGIEDNWMIEPDEARCVWQSMIDGALKGHEAVAP